MPWTGAVRTVGVGKDFAEPSDAMTDANDAHEDCLFLVSPGIYGAGGSSNYKAYVRGLGASASDVIFRGNITGGSILFIENIFTHLNWPYHQGGVVSAETLITNKCIMGISDLTYGYGWPVIAMIYPISAYIGYTLEVRGNRALRDSIRAIIRAVALCSIGGFVVYCVRTDKVSIYP